MTDKHRYRPLLPVAVMGLILRLSVWNRVFASGRIYLDGVDGYYHLRRAFLILQDWPSLPQADPYLNAPYGGLISWPPLFDWILATLALSFVSADPKHTLELIGVFLPPVLGTIQIILIYLLLMELAGKKAAIAGAWIAAVLPGVVRYSLLGTLDHDPFYECCVLISLLAVARVAVRGKAGAKEILLFALGLSTGVLGWVGALIQLGIVGLTTLSVGLSRKETAYELARLTTYGSALATMIVLPFALSSVWIQVHPFTFEGLSLLHVTVLLFLTTTGAVTGLILRPSTTQRNKALTFILLASIVPLILLVPAAANPLLQGIAFAGGSSDVQSLMAEARPLLSLFGTLDFRPLLLRLSILPFLSIPVVAIGFFQSKLRVTSAFFLGWILIPMMFALSHSRFTVSAAIALSAASGFGLATGFFSNVKRRILLGLFFLLFLLTLFPAYFVLPGWGGFNFFSRPRDLSLYQMDEICELLRDSQEQGTVLAPWYMGHWIIWIAERPVVLSPMLSVGQSEFYAGIRFFLETNENSRHAKRFLRDHGVRYVILTPEFHSLRKRAELANVDLQEVGIRRGHSQIDIRRYSRTLEGRLMYFGTRSTTIFGADLPQLEGYREVMRSARTVPSPFGGEIPIVRVYEVNWQ